MKILVTGGAGFIGSNLTRFLLNREKPQLVIVIDNLSTGRLENLSSVMDNPRLKFFHADLTRDFTLIDFVFQRYSPNIIFHLAAEAHVDESIRNPLIASSNFLMTNVLLEKAREYKVERFIHISTDEVYGPIPTGFADENYPLNPSSPYSASKASSDLLCLAYHKTYGVPAIISRCTNNFGPYLDVRRLIARHITNALLNHDLPLWDGGGQMRDWLFVEDHCTALWLLMEKGEPGEIYNIAGGNILRNIEVAEAILRLIPDSKSKIVFRGSRPAHDIRYALNADKVKMLGWKPKYGFEEALRMTIDWYKENEGWWMSKKREIEEKFYGELGR
ncbi:MAG: dTDP-glucose 4,6-dehydratase [bacterium]